MRNVILSYEIIKAMCEQNDRTEFSSKEYEDIIFSGTQDQILTLLLSNFPIPNFKKYYIHARETYIAEQVGIENTQHANTYTLVFRKVRRIEEEWLEEQVVELPINFQKELEKHLNQLKIIAIENKIAFRQFVNHIIILCKNEQFPKKEILYRALKYCFDTNGDPVKKNFLESIVNVFEKARTAYGSSTNLSDRAWICTTGIIENILDVFTFSPILTSQLVDRGCINKVNERNIQYLIHPFISKRPQGLIPSALLYALYVRAFSLYLRGFIGGLNIEFKLNYKSVYDVDKEVVAEKMLEEILFERLNETNDTKKVFFAYGNKSQKEESLRYIDHLILATDPLMLMKYYYKGMFSEEHLDLLNSIVPFAVLQKKLAARQVYGLTEYSRKALFIAQLYIRDKLKTFAEMHQEDSIEKFYRYYAVSINSDKTMSKHFGQLITYIFEKIESKILWMDSFENTILPCQDRVLVDAIGTGKLSVGYCSGSIEKLLYWLFSSGYIASIKKILTLKPKLISKENYLEEIPLHLATKKGLVGLARWLIVDAHADMDQQEGISGNTALHFAVEHAQVNMIKLLLNCKADPNSINYNGKTALYYAICKGQRKAVQLLLDAGGKITLHVAILANDPYILELLLKAGIDPNICEEEGETALQIACSKGYLRCVQILLAAPNIDVNAKRPPNTGCTFSISPLHFAIYSNNVEIARWLWGHPLIDKRAILSELVEHDNVQGFNFLLQHLPFDVNTQTELGTTALHYAVQKSHLEMVQFLLSIEGVRLDLKDKREKTAYDYALEINNHKILKLFLFKLLVERFYNKEPSLLTLFCIVGVVASMLALCNFGPLMLATALILQSVALYVYTPIFVQKRAKYLKETNIFQMPKIEERRCEQFVSGMCSANSWLAYFKSIPASYIDPDYNKYWYKGYAYQLKIEAEKETINLVNNYK